MIEVVSVKFKNRGKSYFFAPNSLSVGSGQQVIVETSKGLEIADCCHGNHMVDDKAVVQPLRPVVRIATEDDLRIAELNKRREREAFEICQKKIAEHKLDMKLVDVECNFEGNKTMFFFTSDGRVDFRDLVKDLAGIFRNRIELRQIGVRDEAKMIGGIGICGRPYCCSQFLDDFQPVSTKMAKVQSLSLNPTKISGSCGRLMCCLRYEQEAYEELIKKAPKQGAFVETKDGYGTAVQVNLLRQTVKVKLDGDGDELRCYKSNELCAVPGGRPKDGEEPPHVLHYVPEPQKEPEEDPANQWLIPNLVIPEPEREEPKKKPRRPKSPKNRPQPEQGRPAQKQNQPKAQDKPPRPKKPQPRKEQPAGEGVNKARPQPRPKTSPKPVKPVKAENKPHPGEQPKEAKKPNRRRGYYHGKPKAHPGGEQK